MSFNDGKKFSRRYKSIDHLARALERNHDGSRLYTAEGKAAFELLELLAFSGTVTMTLAVSGAKIGFMIGGPKGAAIGAGVGVLVGFAGSALVVQWYVEVKKHRSGEVTAIFTPA